MDESIECSSPHGKNPSGFVAGTLVHTKEGLVPIEKIRVGDWLFSKPETVEDEKTYKRVVNTFVHHDREIARIDYKLDGDPNRRYPIISTWDHPFWVKDEGWTAALRLHGPWLSEHKLELIDGSYVIVDENRVVYRTKKLGIGWYGNIHNGNGVERDFINNKLIDNDALIDLEIAESDAPYLMTTVYNFEVEDFHTYYVGKHGVWVHNGAT